MKRFIVLISLIACMLLTACGKDIGNSAIASQKSKPGVSEVVLYEGHDLKLTMKAIYSIQGHRKSIVLNLDNVQNQILSPELPLFPPSAPWQPVVQKYLLNPYSKLKI